MTEKTARESGAVVLVTAPAWDGQDDVLDELARRGQRVVDTDGPGWLIEALTPDGPEPLWEIWRFSSVG